MEVFSGRVLEDNKRVSGEVCVAGMRKSGGTPWGSGGGGLWGRLAQATELPPRAVPHQIPLAHNNPGLRKILVIQPYPKDPESFSELTSYITFFSL